MSSNPIVTSAFFFETMASDDQFNCDLATHFDSDVRDHILSDTEGGRNLTANALSRSVGSAISMNSRRGRMADIPGGWSEKRLSFIITVLTSDYEGGKQRQVLTGYTDHSGVNFLRGTLDEEMVLFVNNSIIIRDTETHSSRGTIYRPRLESSDYVIRGREGRREGHIGYIEGERLIRPHDIFNNIHISEIQRAAGGADKIMDVRGELGGEIKLGRRRENNAADYLSSVVRTGVMAETSEQRGWNPESQFGGELESRAEVAAGALNSGRIDDNPMFTEFMNECDFAKRASITLRSFRNCVDWPDTYRGQDVTHIITPKEMTHRGYESADRGTYDNWKGADPNTVAMRLIAQSVPSILMTNYIADAIIKFNNDNIQGEMKVVMFSPRALIPGTNIDAYATAVEETLRVQVFDPISRWGETLIIGEINCSAVTNIKIKLSIENEPAEIRVVPLYCDGLLSPQKTEDTFGADKITTDLQSTIQEITDSLFQRRDEMDDRETENFSWLND